MPTFFAEQSLTLSSTNAWETVDISAYVPTNAAAVFLKLANPSGYSYTIIARSYDSTTTFTTEGGHGGCLRDYSGVTQIVKVGSSQRISIYRKQSACVASIYGYLTDKEITCIDNMEYVSNTTTSTWESIDFSTHFSSYGVSNVYGVVLHRMVTPDGNTPIQNIRRIGSTFIPPNSGPSQAHGGSLAFSLKENKSAEIYSTNTTYNRYYIVGFLTKDIVDTYLNPTLVSPATTSTWDNISTFNKNVLAGIYQIYSPTYSNSYRYGFKKSSDAAPTLRAPNAATDYSAAPVGTDSIVQGYISNANMQIYQFGYWKQETSGEFFKGVNF